MAQTHVLCRSSLRAFVRRAVLAAVVAAAAAGPPSGRADLAQMRDAYPILSDCAAAQRAIGEALDSVGDRNVDYWSSLRDGESQVAQAYRRSLDASWPVALNATRDAVNARLVAAIGKLSRADNTRHPPRRATAAALLKSASAYVAFCITRLSTIPSGPPRTESPPPPSTPPSAPTPFPTTGDIAVLVPGTGFDGPTPQPAAIGDGAGASAKAIARWDVVPYQTFVGTFAVGVVAFHLAGIDRVEFSVNGGPWTAVRAMSLNPVTGVWEYDVGVDARTLPDGQCEIRAVVYPNVGVPRVLAGPHDAGDRAQVSGEYSLLLSADQGGTLPMASRWASPTGDDADGDGSPSRPFRSIQRAVESVQTASGAADGATIFLTSGEYAYPDMSAPVATSQRWLTISAAPGVTSDKVRITSGPGEGAHGFDTRLVHLRNLTVHSVQLNDRADAQGDCAWAEGCALEGTDPLDPTRFFQPDAWTGGIFVTECVMRDVKYPAYGQTLTRNTMIDSIGGDAFREPAGLVANCEVRNVINLDDAHNDVMQFFNPEPRSGFENVIVYGVKAVHGIDAQALFVQQYGSDVVYRNFAFVNYLAYASYAAQWQNPAEHLLLWNVEILSPAKDVDANKGGLVFGDVDARVTNVHDLSMRGCVLQRLVLAQSGREPSASDPSWARNDHFLDVDSHLAVAPGFDATTGGTAASLFEDPSNDDFTPTPDSGLRRRGAKPLVPADVSGRPRRSPDAIGAVAPPR